MKDKIPVYEIAVLEYLSDIEPDHEKIGKIVDDFIKKHFLGQYVAIRCLGSSEHPGKTVDQMVEIIKTLGHDRYDPQRTGDRYENTEGKHIDFFAFDFHVEEDTKMFSIYTWPFFHWCKERSGKPVRIDIITLYDPTQLDQILFTYEGREQEGERSDGWVFKNQDDKLGAIKAIITIR